jgi:hypothetical protein
MPPRKSTASNPPEDGAEPVPAPTKASKEKDGLGVEVRAHIHLVNDDFSHSQFILGSHITKIDDRPSRKRSTPSKYTSTKGRPTGHA